MVLGQKQNLTPNMGVAYGHVTTCAISEIVTYHATIFKFCLLSDFIGPEHKTRFDPKVGVAYGHVTTFKIPEKNPTFQEWLKVGS